MIYFNVSLEDLAHEVPKQAAAALRNHADTLPAGRERSVVMDTARAFLKLARAAKKGARGAAVWPAVRAVNIACCGMDWQERRNLVEVPLETCCRLLDCPAPGTLGVLKMRKAVRV